MIIHPKYKMYRTYFPDTTGGWHFDGEPWDDITEHLVYLRKVNTHGHSIVHRFTRAGAFWNLVHRAHRTGYLEG